MLRTTIAALTASVLLAGAAQPALAQAAEPAANPELTALSRDTVRFALEYDPTIEYFTGLDAGPQDRFADRSAEALARLEAAEDALYARFRRIDPRGLNRADGIDYAILKEQFESSIGTRVCKFELWNVNHFGWQTGMARLAGQQAVDTPQARAEALKRWSSFPKVVDDEIANLRRGLAGGYSSPKSVVRRVIAQLDSLLAAPADRSPFLTLATRSSDEAFSAEIRRIIAERINPSFARYRDFLRDEYLPKARETLGVTAHPNGAACYEASLRSYTTLTRSGAEVYRLGLETVAANTERVKEMGRQAFGTSDLAAIVAHVANDPENRFKDEAELLAYSRAIVDRAAARMDQAFENVPTQPVVVEPFPEFMRGSGVSSHYNVETDPTKPGKYMINLDDVPGERRSQAAVTAVHEAWPGHHLQLAYSARLPKSDIAKLSFNGAYVEGWGRYSEHLAEELGVYDDRYSPIARRLWPARGMVLDPGVHLYNWTPAQVEAYVMESGRFTAQDAKDLADRIAMWPGQLTAYDSGALQIMALRRQAEEALGSKFDLKRFHTVVLGSGVVPLAKLRENVEAWIAAERAR